MYPDQKHHITAPWGCFQIVNILFRSRDIALYKYVPTVTLELIMHISKSHDESNNGCSMKNLQCCKNKSGEIGLKGYSAMRMSLWGIRAI